MSLWLPGFYKRNIDNKFVINEQSIDGFLNNCIFETENWLILRDKEYERDPSEDMKKSLRSLPIYLKVALEKIIFIHIEWKLLSFKIKISYKDGGEEIFESLVPRPIAHIITKLDNPRNTLN